MATSLIIDKNNEKKYKDLSAGVRKRKAFSTQKSVHLAAAIVALKLKLDPKDIRNKHDFIKYTALSGKEQKVMKYIALTSTDDPYILADQEKIVDIVNGLANAGFPSLYEAVAENSGDHVYSLIEYCQKYYWQNE